MLLSAHEIAQSREHVLNSLLGFSNACLEAGQRFGELFSTTSREVMHHGRQGWTLDSPAELPATLWLENAARAGRMLDGTLAILGETHKAMIRNAEVLICVFDEMAIASINRAVRTSPWEAELALSAMRTTLQSAEQAVHDLSEAAIDTVALAESELHQATRTIASH